MDTIADYNVVNDTIQLENAVFTTLTATGTLLYDANGNGAGAMVQIAILGTGLAMVNGDFVVT